MEREEINQHNSLKRNGPARFIRYFGLIMAVFYWMMGLLIAFFPIFEDVSTTIRYIFAGMLVVYGFFRFYRVMKQQ